jgi:hypothetical protein
MLPELSIDTDEPPTLTGEFSSEDRVLSSDGTRQLLIEHGLLLEDVNPADGELLR